MHENREIPRTGLGGWHREVRKTRGVRSKAPVKAGKEQGVKVPRMVMVSDRPWRNAGHPEVSK